jgi:hypothetical protein
VRWTRCCSKFTARVSLEGRAGNSPFRGFIHTTANGEWFWFDSRRPDFPFFRACLNDCFGVRGGAGVLASCLGAGTAVLLPFAGAQRARRRWAAPDVDAVQELRRGALRSNQISHIAPFRPPMAPKSRSWVIRRSPREFTSVTPHSVTDRQTDSIDERSCGVIRSPEATGFPTRVLIKPHATVTVIGVPFSLRIRIHLTFNCVF